MLFRSDLRTVDIELSGNLGSDGSTQSWVRSVVVRGEQIPYTVTSDAPENGAPRDARVVHMVVPSNPAELENVNIGLARDNVTYGLNDVTLPVTFYVSIGYADPAVVAEAIAEDIEVLGGDGDAVGRFSLSVDAD